MPLTGSSRGVAAHRVYRALPPLARAQFNHADRRLWPSCRVSGILGILTQHGRYPRSEVFITGPLPFCAPSLAQRSGGDGPSLAHLSSQHMTAVGQAMRRDGYTQGVGWRAWRTCTWTAWTASRRGGPAAPPARPAVRHGAPLRPCQVQSVKANAVPGVGQRRCPKRLLAVPAINEQVGQTGHLQCLTASRRRVSRFFLLGQLSRGALRDLFCVVSGCSCLPGCWAACSRHGASPMCSVLPVWQAGVGNPHCCGSSVL